MDSTRPNSNAALPADMPVVYFGNDWNAENRTSSHHIARRLAARGSVLYVECPGLRAPQASARDLRKLAGKLQGVWQLPREVARGFWVYTLPQIPFRRFPGVPAFNRAFSAWAVRRAIRSVGFRRYLAWFVVPHVGFLAGRLREELDVYYCIDDYSAHPGVDAATVQPLDDALSRAADVLFVAPPALLESKQRLNANTHFSPHGVDAAMFARASDPAERVAPAAADLRKPVIGFWGVLGEWNDLDLLEFLGRARPEWTFLVVGRVAVDASRLRALGNFVFPGPQPYESLPSWARAVDVAIIPFLLNRQVLNANPLKLREYLASGKPVVAISTPEIDRFADVVLRANNHQEFLDAIEVALRDDSPEKRAARQSAVRPLTWEARFAETWDKVAECWSRKGCLR